MFLVLFFQEMDSIWRQDLRIRQLDFGGYKVEKTLRPLKGIRLL